MELSKKMKFNLKINLKRSIYKGMIPTLLRDVPFSGLYWYLYEKNKKYFEGNFDSKTLNPFFVNFLSGATAGTISSIVTNPIDVVKTRIVKKKYLNSKFFNYQFQF